LIDKGGTYYTANCLFISALIIRSTSRGLLKLNVQRRSRAIVRIANLPYRSPRFDIGMFGSVALFVRPCCGLTKAETRDEARRKPGSTLFALERMLRELKKLGSKNLGLSKKFPGAGITALGASCIVLGLAPCLLA